jgi:ketosteroid isomerase-like protein
MVMVESRAVGNVERVKEIYAAFARGDVALVLGGMHPDIEWTEAEGFPYAGTYRGPDAIVQNVFMKLGSEWEGFQVRPHEFLEAGSAVVVLGRYSGRYRATGRAMEADFAHVWRLRDHKIAAFKQYVDSALVQRAITR